MFVVNALLDGSAGWFVAAFHHFSLSDLLACNEIDDFEFFAHFEEFPMAISV
jgi:hypothetical protein